MEASQRAVLKFDSGFCRFRNARQRKLECARAGTGVSIRDDGDVGRVLKPAAAGDDFGSEPLGGRIVVRAVVPEERRRKYRRLFGAAQNMHAMTLRHLGGQMHREDRQKIRALEHGGTERK